MSTEDAQKMNEQSAGPTIQQKIHGKVEEVAGKAQVAHAKRTGDLIEGMEGAAKELHGRVEHTLAVSVEEAIGQSEREGAAGVIEGQRHRIRGAAEETVGRAEAKLGQQFHKPEQEQEGIARQVAGGIEKSAGEVEEEASKGAFQEALREDAEYMKPTR